MKNQTAIEAQIAKAVDGVIGGSRWPNMSYEEGVQAALEWVIGDAEEPPMEDE